jgi:nitrite reductase/ring-hydroxylating ferredoxin subunit
LLLADEPAPVASANTKPAADAWVSVLAPEELPKGVRKEVSIDGTAVLLFWYRNQIYAIAARSPAEGAYSEGFIKAKFTQDYGIICTQTGSVFSLKDGSVAEWYPSNPVLRAITPMSEPLPVRPLPGYCSPEKHWFLACPYSQKLLCCMPAPDAITDTSKPVLVYPSLGYYSCSPGQCLWASCRCRCIVDHQYIPFPDSRHSRTFWTCWTFWTF